MTAGFPRGHRGLVGPGTGPPDACQRDRQATGFVVGDCPLAVSVTDLGETGHNWREGDCYCCYVSG